MNLSRSCDTPRGALLAMTRRQSSQSIRDRLGVAEKAAVGGAARAGSQAFVRQRQGNVALAGPHGRLGQGPVDDVALCVAAADLPEIKADRQQQLDCLGPGA